MRTPAPSAIPIRLVKSTNNNILRAELEAFTKVYRECFIIVPGKLSAWPGSIHAAGTLGQHFVTFPQAARQLAEPLLAQESLTPLGSLGIEALAARSVFRAREQGVLEHFAPVAGLPGFARALARTLAELRLAKAPADRLADGDAPARDLALLLELYEEELDAGRFADLPLILEMASEIAGWATHRWAGLPVAFLDVPLESRAHRDLFRALTAHAPAAFAATSGPPESFESLLGVAALDLDTAPATDSLEQLRRNLFAPAPEPAPRDGRFELFSAPGEGLEAVEVARRLLQLAKQGVPFDHCAVLLRNPERYQPAFEDAFRRAGIPAYFSRGANRPDAAGRAFLALLGCAADNLSATRFAEYMSLGQVPAEPAAAEWVPPADEVLANEGEPPAIEPRPESRRPTPRRWEQYLVDAAVIGGRDRWERRLRGLEAEWELQAENNAERLTQLRNLREFALPLIGAMGDLPKAAKWEDWITALRDLAARALRAPERVLEVLAELAPMADVGPATLEEVIEVLDERLRFLRSEPTGRRWGRVLVASIDEARGCSFGNVFLPGLGEGLFPQKTSEDPLLLDDLRRAVDAQLPLRHDKVTQERERLHLAAAAAQDRLIASYPRMEVAEARPRVPSFYALELPRAVDGSLPELAQFEAQAREAAPARLNWPAPRNKMDAIDAAEYDLASIAHKSAHHILTANECAARSLRARYRRWEKKWSFSDGLITSDPAALAALEHHRLNARPWSPSALENFSTCPYKFALHGVYRLRPREDAVPLEQMDPLTRGSLFHAVQFELCQQLQSAGELPVTRDSLPAAMARLETVLDQVSKHYAETLAPAIPRVWASEIEDLRSDLRGWLHFTATNEYEWTPVHFELPLELNLPELVNLRGRIDVVEQNGDKLRVTDYKTGKPPEMVPRWVGGGKYLQPLLYAVAAEQHLGTKVEAGRLLFATQRGNYTPIEIKLDDRARQFLTKLLDNIDYMIRGGFLPPFPEKDACGMCDYSSVCGPYEERRVQKKDRDSERLDPLVEIRGMA